MSRLEELIKQYCPNGVAFRQLGEITDLITKGTTPKQFTTDGINFIKTEAFENASINPTKVAHISLETHNTELKRSILQENDILIAIAGSIGKVVIVPQSILPANTNQALAIIRIHKNEASYKYVYYVLQSNYMVEYIKKKVKGSAQPNLTLQLLNDFLLPLPPLPVQEEIVRIIDTFTELETELEVELEARKKQYEYYRDLLLTFGKDVPFEKLNNVFEMRNGYTPSKANPEYWTDGTIPWIRMEDIRANGGVLYDAIQKVNKSAIKGGRLFPKGTIAFATSATIGVHCLLMTDCLTNQRFTAIYPKPKYRDKLIPKFIYYIGFNIDKYCLEHQQVSNMASVDMNAFKEFSFPIPPLAEQERIVSILDKFDTLCNDLTQGLPKELELHRKQYEYYRDRLLTFQRKDA